MADFYNPKEVEEKYYKICEKRGYFEIDGNKNIQKKGKNFCIMMPPPNVTGVLHIGHALTFTLQDIMTRYKRMDGFKCLYQPGMDHAGIATQNVVENRNLMTPPKLTRNTPIFKFSHPGVKTIYPVRWEKFGTAIIDGFYSFICDLFFDKPLF